MRKHGTTRPNESIVIKKCVPGQNFRDASVGDAKLARDIARPDTVVGQLDDALPDDVWKRAAVHEHAA